MSHKYKMGKVLKRGKIGPKVDKFQHYDIVVYAARGSNGARRLATALGARRWRDDLPERYQRRRPYFRGNNSPMVVNWGSTVHPRWLEDSRFRLKPVFVNHANGVEKAIDKLAFFQQASGIDGVPLLKWTDKRETALSWISKGKPVICRTKLGGSSGEGIVLARSAEQLVEAKLYTRYYPKTHEFRVHVFGNHVIDLTQKRFKGGSDVRSESNTLVRSLDNGWVHAHNLIELRSSDRERVEAACGSIIAKLELQFGAVDVLAILDPPSADGTRSLKSFVICEVNTGPGLENTVTIEAYKKAILELKNSTANTSAELERTRTADNNKTTIVVVEEQSNGSSVEGIPGDQP